MTISIRLRHALRATLFCLAAAILLPGAHAQTLRWATQGDPQTLDPYSQNEILTNAFNGQIYEFLVARDRQLGLVPGLATGWTQDAPLQWTFKLRPNVKFHDGRPFTADDVVFSVNRAAERTSQIAAYASALGTPRKIDDRTVRFTLARFDPIFLQHLNAIYIMSKSWCEEHHAIHPQDFSRGEEAWTALHANGTGPYMLVSRQPDVRTVLKRNPTYWGKIEGNLQQVIHTPIPNDATRLAALVSGEIDLMLDPAPADLGRLRAAPGLKVFSGPENRIIYIGMDQARDGLLHGSLKDRNPFKDVRVRRALYQAIDIEAIRARLMAGQAAPTGAMAPSPLATFGDAELEKRLPYDLAAARRDLAAAGYAGGFEVTLDCPNNRYVNDERLCAALAAMWAKLNIRVKVNAMPKSSYFPKLEKLDTSLYLMGWGGSVTDAETIFTPVLRNRGAQGVGAYNYGNYKDDALDALAAASSHETDPAKRRALIEQAYRREAEQVHYLPLYRQFVPWAARSNVDLVHRADNWLELRWVSVR